MEDSASSDFPGRAGQPPRARSCCRGTAETDLAEVATLDAARGDIAAENS